MNTNTSNLEQEPEQQAPKQKFQKSHIAIGISIVIVLLLIGIVYKYKSLAIAATVNGRVISRVSVIKELEKQGGKNTLDMLITRQLINEEVKAKNINITDAEINTEIAKYETQFSGQGQTLDLALKAQHLTRNDLREQIGLQKKVEKLVEDKLKVSDEELIKYLTDNKIALPTGQEERVKSEVLDQLKQQKLGAASTQLIQEIKAKAKIKTFINY